MPPQPKSSALRRQPSVIFSFRRDGRDFPITPPRTRRVQTELIRDPLVQIGRHLGRAVHAFCHLETLVFNGSVISAELDKSPDDILTAEERHQIRTYRQVLDLVPILAEKLSSSSYEEIRNITQFMQRGVTLAKADDIASLKGEILEWITPPGHILHPPLRPYMKIDRGFHHAETGALLCPAHLNWSDNDVREMLISGGLSYAPRIWPVFVWPIFIFQDHTFNPENPWDGLFRSALLVRAYKYLFTSIRAISNEPKAGGVCIHDMAKVTLPSIAYVATQVRHALSSSSVLSRVKPDTSTDSEAFYHSVLNFFDEYGQKREVEDLRNWWNGYSPLTTKVFTAFPYAETSMRRH